MSWTNITKPAVGDPTKKQSFADKVVDNFAYLFNAFLSLVGTRETIINGSFESDADGDTFPDGWTLTKYNGGTFLHDTSTATADGKAVHGKRSIKFTSPGGGGNGGGYVTSTDFFEITDGRSYKLTWQHKSSVAGIHNLVQIQFYDSAQASLSTTTLYDSAANPTAWTPAYAAFAPPANARYAKIILTGAKDDNATAGSAWFDDVRIQNIYFEDWVTIDATLGAGGGTTLDGKWTCPAGVFVAEVEAIGAGAGGGNAGNAGGGGAGGYSKAVVNPTPATAYTFSIGVGGAAGAAGGNTTITIGSVTLTANGGGAPAGATGGTGGTASGGTVNTSGGNATNGGGGTGGNGGASVPYGVNSTGDAGDGEPGATYGAGGAGAGAAGVGGIGFSGCIRIRFADRS